MSAQSARQQLIRRRWVQRVPILTTESGVRRIVEKNMYSLISTQNRSEWFGFVLVWLLSCSVLMAQAASADPNVYADIDRDGLSDTLEQSLLVQFMPKFMISGEDCSGLPAEFKLNSATPVVEAENGTVYGQAFPLQSATSSSGPAVELHYYHLWRSDCGRHGHPLDTEHVAVLVHASEADVDNAQWKAVYWYAAAHENTVCDVSQIARASTLHAEDHGASIWISRGKHASYLDSAICRKGCGADHCVRATELRPPKVVNLGEPGYPMNDSVFISSKAWPLEYKMSTSNFPAAAIAHLNEVSETEIAFFNTGRHPVQGIIANSSSTEQALAKSGAKSTAAIGAGGDTTGEALSTAAIATDGALSSTTDTSGNAIQKSWNGARQALATSIRSVADALHLRPKRDGARK